MLFPKKPRIVDEELLELVRTLPCLACGITPSQAHHVTHVGAGGDDIATNVMPLCAVHHGEWHVVGGKQMASEYPVILNWCVGAERFDIISAEE